MTAISNFVHFYADLLKNALTAHTTATETNDHAKMAKNRYPVAQIIADPETAKPLNNALEKVRAARDTFNSLPVNEWLDIDENAKKVALKPTIENRDRMTALENAVAEFNTLFVQTLTAYYSDSIENLREMCVHPYYSGQIKISAPTCKKQQFSIALTNTTMPFTDIIRAYNEKHTDAQLWNGERFTEFAELLRVSTVNEINGKTGKDALSNTQIVKNLNTLYRDIFGYTCQNAYGAKDAKILRLFCMSKVRNEYAMKISDAESVQMAIFECICAHANGYDLHIYK